MKVRHFLSIKDFSKKELEAVLRQAAEIKKNPRGFRNSLKGKTLGLLFSKPSTRTRVSFEAGIYQLGGNAVFLSEKEIQTGRGEAERDTAVVLSRYIDAVVIRTYKHEYLKQFAEYSSIPVVNGLSDMLHPCQILSDIFTIIEKKGRIKGINIVYIGDGRNNIANSWTAAASIFGIRLTIAAPPEYQPANFEVRKNVKVTSDIKRAVSGADILYTDVWVSMGQERQKRKRLSVLRPYQINNSVLSLSGGKLWVMHCLPAHPGQEITKDVLYGPRSIVFLQAENRLYVQKALLIKLMGGRHERP